MFRYIKPENGTFSPTVHDHALHLVGGAGLRILNLSENRGLLQAAGAAQNDFDDQLTLREMPLHFALAVVVFAGGKRRLYRRSPNRFAVQRAISLAVEDDIVACVFSPSISPSIRRVRCTIPGICLRPCLSV